MTYSFTAAYNPPASCFDKVSRDVAGTYSLQHFFGWAILIRTPTTNTVDYSFESDACSARLLVGDIQNLSELRTIGSIYFSDAPMASPVRLITALHQAIGDRVFGLIEGGFNLVRFGADGELDLGIDALGLQPVHFVTARTLWITSELKNIRHVEPGIFDFEDVDIVAGATSHPDDYTPIRNDRRAKPGTMTRLRQDGAGHPFFSTQRYSEKELQSPLRMTMSSARDLLFDLLSISTKNAIQSGGRIAIPLSGGLDSSTITALAVKAGASVDTYSIGTLASDEFEHSRSVARHLGTNHQEMILDDSDILQGIHEAVYINEVFDGLSAEIQSGLMCLYKFLENKCDRVITGYGADLLFGGVLRPGMASASVNLDLFMQVYRTRWTGEFSPFAPKYYGLSAVHPFWTGRLMGFALNLTPELKLSSDEVKVVLRSCVGINNLLPPEIVWRRKIGIHEGTSINQVFADKLRVTVGDYAAKTRYTYSMFKSFLRNELAISDVNSLPLMG